MSSLSLFGFLFFAQSAQRKLRCRILSEHLDLLYNMLKNCLIQGSLVLIGEPFANNKFSYCSLNPAYYLLICFLFSFVLVTLIYVTIVLLIDSVDHLYILN